MFNIFLLKVLLSKKLISSVVLKSDPNQLFEQTRWRLASWYAGILAVVLGISGFSFYQVVTYAHRLTIDQELESQGNQIHEHLEPILKHPGKLEANITRVFPHICLVETECYSSLHSDPHASKAIQPGTYYIRLLDISGNLVAVVGKQPPGLSKNISKDYWQNLKDTKGDRYRQISLVLHTQDFQSWGYLQVGRPLKEFDHYASNLRWMLLMGLPAAIALLMLVSWWLAGRAMQPVYQSYQLLQQFSTDAAHELRTPLAAIRATIESTLMTNTVSPTEMRETLQTIRRQNLRLSKLVADLLLLCRMDRDLTVSSPVQSDREPISLKDLVTNITEDFAALALASEIDLSAEILVSTPLIIIGNYEQLYRLVSNLTSNALKYTPPGGKVTLILDRSSNCARVRVRDTGIGISSDDRQKIFDRFYRVDSERSRTTGGSGLGLSIAMAIAAAHQGAIEVQSELGKGSNFIILLPLRKNIPT
ncbi:MAG: ATP-binding protein [Prochloraceae cyanobacterium]|nr:ATP-binding protein [Prochloraceae cyanobacterium]